MYIVDFNVFTMLTCYSSLPYLDGLSLLNEDGGLRVVFPRNSFVTNSTLTHTNNPRSVTNQPGTGNDHIACYGGNPGAAQIAWHNSGGPLTPCGGNNPVRCLSCGGICRANGGVGPDPPLNGLTYIHIYTDSTGYRNQDLECRVAGGQSAFIGVYLKDGGDLVCLYLCTCYCIKYLLNFCASFKYPILTIFRLLLWPDRQ